MKLKAFIKRLLIKTAFYPKWRCISCGKEVFNDEYFCEECKKGLPVIGSAYCNHCGRKVKVAENYCSTCRNTLVALDKCRSIYDYQPPIDKLIKSAKYYGGKYILDCFTDDIKNVYIKNTFSADFIAFVPMTKKAYKKRGYNQSKILAENLSNGIGVPLFSGIEKTKETKNQASLNRKERQENLSAAFRVTDKASIKDKSVLIVDDVTTTGATAETLAEKLKKAGAKQVYLITIASVAPADKY